MAKSVTRYDEVGNAVIREARPASNVRTAPRDVKAKGPLAVAAWNKANKPPAPGKTAKESIQFVERQIYKRAADMRAKKTIASTARSFTGGQLLEALSANNGPKVAPDAPVTQKRAAIASGMAARAANRTEAGGSDGGPKRRAAERFARVARGEKPFGGAAVARNDRDLGRAGGVADKLKGLSKAQLREVAKEMGEVSKASASAKALRESIEKSVVSRNYQAAKMVTVEASGGGGMSMNTKPVTGTQIDAAVSKSRSAAFNDLDKAIEKVKAASPAKPAKGSRAGKAKTPRTVSIMGDNKYLTPPGAGGLTNAQKDAMVVKGGPPPSFIDKVNAAQAASDAARKNAPKPPATPPGPRDHWNRIGSPQPVKAATSIPPPAVKATPVVTNDSAMGMKPPAPPAPPVTPPSSGFKMPTWRQANTGLAVVGTGVAAAQAFNKAKQEGKSTGEAMGAGALAATPGALMLGAQPIGNALSKAGSGAMKIGVELIDEGTNLNFMNWASNWFLAKTGLATSGTGAAMKAAGEGLKIAGKVAAPAMAAWGAYQGAKEDDNKLRGAARGALRSLDPSAIVTGIGAGTGLMKDGRGLGERAYDAAFGGPTQGRLSSTQAQTFAKADTNYDHMGHGQQPQATGERPGWSDEARIKAYYAKFPMGTNAPYGGDPSAADGYKPPAAPKEKGS